MAAQKPPDRRASAPGPERRERQPASGAPRYPHVHVTLHSSNPYAVVSAVRLAMRRSKIDAAEVARFSDEAFASEEPRRMREVCDSWADVEVKT